MIKPANSHSAPTAARSGPLTATRARITVIAAKHHAENAYGPFPQRCSIWHLDDDSFVRFVEWMLAGIPHEKISKLCRTELALPSKAVPHEQAQKEFWKYFGQFWKAMVKREDERQWEQEQFRDCLQIAVNETAERVATAVCDELISALRKFLIGSTKA